MNVIVDILYLHIFKITVCSVDDCSFKVLLRQSQGYDACKKKKKKKGLCYITEEEAAQTHLRCTITCNHDNTAEVRRATASSLFLKPDWSKEEENHNSSSGQITCAWTWPRVFVCQSGKYPVPACSHSLWWECVYLWPARFWTGMSVKV